MGTSGSFDWTATRNQIVNRSLRIIGAIDQEGSPTAAQLSNASEALNSIVKNLQTMNLGLWAREWTTKALAISTLLTHNAVNYLCVRSHTSSAAGATGDEPGVGDDWETFWMVGGTGGAAWATATAYNAIGDFVPAADTIYIEEAFVRRADSDHPMRVIRYDAYLSDVGTKYSTGLPNVLAFNNSLADPHAFTYPQSDSVTDIIHYLRYRKLENFDGAANNPDAPVAWIEVLVFALARRLSPEYGLPLEERYYLGREATRFLNAAKKSDQEVVTAESLDPIY